MMAFLLYNCHMPTSKEFLNYVLELLRDVKDVSYKYMMSEYILYKDNVIFGGVYDNRFLIKITRSNKEYGFKEQLPYPGAKPMYLVDIENPEEIKELVLQVCADLTK